jgi:hypothetical protein
MYHCYCSRLRAGVAQCCIVTAASCPQQCLSIAAETALLFYISKQARSIMLYAMHPSLTLAIEVSVFVHSSSSEALWCAKLNAKCTALTAVTVSVPLIAQLRDLAPAPTCVVHTQRGSVSIRARHSTAEPLAGSSILAHMRAACA